MASVETDKVAFQNACFKSILLMKIVSFKSTQCSVAGFCTSVVRLFQGLSLNSMTPNRSLSSTSANSSCCFAGDTGKNLSLTGTVPSTNWIECSSTLSVRGIGYVPLSVLLWP
ncbi:uncharacterized protein [Drosophila suzukii]